MAGHKSLYGNIKKHRGTGWLSLAGSGAVKLSENYQTDLGLFG